jgi:hypothetical protein
MFLLYAELGVEGGTRLVKGNFCESGGSGLSQVGGMPARIAGMGRDLRSMFASLIVII